MKLFLLLFYSFTLKAAHVEEATRVYDSIETLIDSSRAICKSDCGPLRDGEVEELHLSIQRPIRIASPEAAPVETLYRSMSQRITSRSISIDSLEASKDLLNQIREEAELCSKNPEHQAILLEYIGEAQVDHSACKTAKEKNVIIRTREINPNAFKYLAIGNPTKPLTMKGKSAEFGHLKGTIPTNAFLSKIIKPGMTITQETLSELEKYQAYNEELLSARPEERTFKPVRLKRQNSGATEHSITCIETGGSQPISKIGTQILNVTSSWIPAVASGTLRENCFYSEYFAPTSASDDEAIDPQFQMPRSAVVADLDLFSEGMMLTRSQDAGIVAASRPDDYAPSPQSRLLASVVSRAYDRRPSASARVDTLAPKDAGHSSLGMEELRSRINFFRQEDFGVSTIAHHGAESAFPGKPNAINFPQEAIKTYQVICEEEEEEMRGSGIQQNCRCQIKFIRDQRSLVTSFNEILSQGYQESVNPYWFLYNKIAINHNSFTKFKNVLQLMQESLTDARKLEEITKYCSDHSTANIIVCGAWKEMNERKKDTDSRYEEMRMFTFYYMQSMKILDTSPDIFCDPGTDGDCRPYDAAIDGVESVASVLDQMERVELDDAPPDRAGRASPVAAFREVACAIPDALEEPTNPSQPQQQASAPPSPSSVSCCQAFGRFIQTSCSSLREYVRQHWPRSGQVAAEGPPR